MSQNKKVDNYAEALYAISKKMNCIDSTAEKLQKILSIYSSLSVFRFFINTKRINSSGKKEIIKNIFLNSLSELEIGFLCELIDNDDVDQLRFIIDKFMKIYNNNSKTVNVTVTTSHQLDSNDKNALLSEIEAKVNEKVNLDNKIDPDLIGGVKFRIGNMIFDGSMASRLKKIEKSLYET